MKKVLAIVLAGLMLATIPVVYAVGGERATSVIYGCPYCRVTCVARTESYSFYRPCSTEKHVYVYGFNIFCGNCDTYLEFLETYQEEEDEATPHAFDENGVCFCGYHKAS